MRKLFIAAPWMGPVCAAFYVSLRWGQLPARIAVTFFHGEPTGWGAKTVAIPFLFALCASIMALLTVLLLKPDKLRMREPAASTLMGATGTLSDEPAEQQVRERILFAAHLAMGVLFPLSIMNIVGWNLR